MSESATARDYERAMGSMDAAYTMYGGTKDPVLMAILRLLENKLGVQGNSPASAAITEALMIGQAALGFGNGGMSMAANINASMQRYGMLTSGPAGTGFLGGRDVATYYASQALFNQQQARYIDPLTGIPNARAQNLNAQELGQAISLTMRSGYQFTSGIRMEGTGKQAKLTNTAQFDRQVQDAVTTFRLMKEVMGSKAIENLEKSMTELFGGNINQFGQTAAKMRLLHIKTLGNTFFGGNMDQALNFSVNGSMLGIAQGLGGPNMSDAEARYRYGAYAAHSSALVDRLALAGGRASAANSAVLTPYGGPVLRERPVDVVGQGRIDQEVGILTESDSLIAAADAAMKAGVMGDKEAMAEYEAIARELVDAGGDPQKIDAANAKLNEYVYRKTGRSVGQIDTEKLRQDPGVAKLTSPFVQGIVESRNQNWLGETMADEYITMGMTNREDAKTLGLGAANLAVEDFAELQQALQSGDAGRINEVLGRESVVTALSRAGLSPDAFSAIVQGGDPDKVARATALARGLSERSLESFVGTGDAAKSAREMLGGYMRSIEGGGRNEGDWMSELIKGIYGVESFTDAQLIDTALRDGEDVTKLKVGANGKVTVTDENIEDYRKMLAGESGVNTKTKEELQQYLDTPEGMQRLIASAQSKGRVMSRLTIDYGEYMSADGKTPTISREPKKFDELRKMLIDEEGIPKEVLTDAASLEDWLDKGSESEKKAKRELYRKNVGTVTGGDLYFLENEKALETEKKLQYQSKERIEKNVADLADKSFVVDAKPDDADYDKKFEEALNKTFGSRDAVASAIGKITSAADEEGLTTADKLLDSVAGKLDRPARKVFSKKLGEVISMEEKALANHEKGYAELTEKEGVTDEVVGKEYSALSLRRQKLEQLKELQESLKNADQATTAQNVTINATNVSINNEQKRRT